MQPSLLLDWLNLNNYSIINTRLIFYSEQGGIYEKNNAMLIDRSDEWMQSWASRIR